MTSNQNKNTEYAYLWQRIKGGDQEAMGILFQKMNKRMYNYGYKIVDDPTLVRDAIQEVFVTVWRRKEHLTDVSSVPAYLFVSLKRKLYRMEQKRQRNYQKEDSLIEHTKFRLSADELDIKDAIGERDKEKLAMAINTLPPQKREVVYLFFYNGMDYEEISDIMDLHIRTVRNYMSEALKRIRHSVKIHS